MTSFAVSIWAFQKTGSALVLSLSTLFIYIPKIFVGICAGPLIDKINKKHAIIITDICCGFCTTILFCLLVFEKLEIWHIYCLNLVSSIFNTIQSKTSNVVISQIVNREDYTHVSGLKSFSGGLQRIGAPIFAALLLNIIGMTGIVFIDIATMLFACITLGIFVVIPFIPKMKGANYNIANYFKEIAYGFSFIKAMKLLVMMLIILGFVDFVSGITYANLITPLILARTGDNALMLSYVRTGMGLGDILGGFLATIITIPEHRSKFKLLLICCLTSFLFGDLIIGAGPNIMFWIVGAFMGNFLTPMAGACQDYLWRVKVPVEVQGKVFACRDAIRDSLMAVGILSGGILADYIFEPFMVNKVNILTPIFGTAKGAGMSVMFGITGISGIIINIFGLYKNHRVHYEEDLR
jgi:MFS family permease